MRQFANLRLRTKAYLATAVITTIFAVLGAIFIAVQNHQGTILSRIEHHYLPRAVTFSERFSALSRAHAELFDILASASGLLDEETLYLRAKPNLLMIHGIGNQLKESEISAGLSEANRESILHVLEHLDQYIAAAGSAIKMASVDVDLARQHLATANQNYIHVNEHFLAIIDSTRSEMTTAIARATQTAVDQSLTFKAVAVVGVIIVFLFGWMALSVFVRNLKAMTRAMSFLANGNAALEIRHTGRNDVIGEMARALEVFRDNTLRIQQTEAELRHARDELEMRVIERTAALDLANEELHAQIDERKLIDSTLRSMQQRSNAVLNKALQSIIVTDEKGKIEVLNAAAEGAFGYSLFEGLGRDVTELFEIVDQEQVEDPVRSYFSDEHVERAGLRIEVTARRKDGTTFPAILTLTRLELEQKTEYCFLLQDITDQIRFEQALKENEENHRRLVEACPTAFYVQIGGKITYINQAGIDQLGAPSADQLVGRNAFDFIHPDDRLGIGSRRQSLVDGADKVPMAEYRMLRYDGSTYSAEASASRLTWNGQPAIVVARTDISERKAAEEALRQSEAYLQSVLLNIAEGIVTIDEQGRIESINPAAEDLFGYTASELVGRNVSMLMPEPYRGEHDGYIGAYIRTGAAKIIGASPRELHATRKDGSVVAISLSISEMWLADRQLFIGAVRDISKRKAAQEALRASEERFRILSDNLPGLIYQRVLYPDGTIEIPFVNEGVRDTHGIEPEMVMADSSLMSRLVHPDDQPKWQAAVKRSGERMERLAQDFRIVRTDGETKWLRGISRPRARDDGAIVWDGLTMDITEQKLVEESSKETERRFQALIDNSPSSIFLKDLDSRLLLVNKAYERYYGITQEEAFGRRGAAWVDPKVLEMAVRADREVIETRQASEEVVERRDNGGRVSYAKSIKFPVFDAEGSVYALGGITTDITDQVLSEKSLKESEARYRRLVDESPDPTYVTVAGKIVFVNAASVEKFGAAHPNDLVGLSSLDLFDPEERPKILARRKEAVALGRALPFVQAKHIRFDGGVFHGESAGTPITWEGIDAYLVVIREITDRLRAEEEKSALEAQLRQSQKMESLGTLAGGTAHEFNNMLLPILGLTELAMREIPEDSRAHQNLSRVVENANRAAQLVEKILSFSRADEPKRSALDLRGVVIDAIELLRATLPATITFHEEISEKSSFVLGDETQIHQILMNLAANAKHAMAGGVGELTVGLADVDVDRELVTKLTNLKPGPHAMLFVQDTGSGIDENIIARIFDPFFTTKEVGEGTGLGLAMIHGIVTAHGGAIDVESELGRGTTFNIYLPLATQQEEALVLAN